MIYEIQSCSNKQISKYILSSQQARLNGESALTQLLTTHFEPAGLVL